MRRPVAVLLALVAGLALVVVVDEQASSARLAPSVTMSTLTPRIDVGTHPKFSYSTSGTQAGSTVQLQRLSGGSWTLVATVPTGTNKTATAAALSSMGRYTYRMQVFTGGVPVATTLKNHDVYAYAGITIKALCPATGGTRQCVHNKTNVGGTDLVTAMAIGSAAYPNYYDGAFMDRTSCRSLTLRFTNPHNATANTRVKIHQPGLTDQAAFTGHGQIGHLNATLSGGRFDVDGSLEARNDSIFIAGTASCWTATGSY